MTPGPDDPAYVAPRECLTFGPHQGIPISRVPAHYLDKIARDATESSEKARNELKRRGTTFHPVEVSRHALDRASLYLQKDWRRTRTGKDEGQASWASRMALEAIAGGRLDGEGRYLHEGMAFVVAEDLPYPVVITIIPRRRKK